MKKLAYICSPFRADSQDGVKENIQQAIKHGRRAMREGYVPIIPHIFTESLWGIDTDDDKIDQEIVEFDMALLMNCDLMVVCGDKISKGMKAEIGLCEINNKDIIYYE